METKLTRNGVESPTSPWIHQRKYIFPMIIWLYQHWSGGQSWPTEIPIQLDCVLDATKISLFCVDIEPVPFRNPLKIKSEIVLDFIYLTLRR